MSDQHVETQSQDVPPVHSGIYTLRTILRFKWFILLCAFLSTAVAIVISLQLPNWYKSTVVIVPPKKNVSALESALGSSVSGALKDFGLTKLGGAGGEGYSYLVILESRTLKDSLIRKYNLIKDYDVPDTAMAEARATLEENLGIVYEVNGNYSISISHPDKIKAATMANDAVAIANGIARSIEHREASTNREYIERRIESINQILKNVSDSLGVFSRRTLVFSAPDQAKVLASGIGEVKSQLVLQELKLDLLERNYGANDPAVLAQQGTINELKQTLSNMVNKPGYAGNFTVGNASQVGAEYVRLAAEFEAYSKAKAMLTPVLEQTKMEEQREAPNMYVVDKAIPAEKKDKPKRSIIVLGAFVGGIILAILLIILRAQFKHIAAQYRAVVAAEKTLTNKGAE